MDKGIITQNIDFPNAYNIAIDIKRIDLVDEEISGNKFFKLKYNIEYALKNKFKQIITFGGAYSNHIAAVAAAGKRYGLKTIGIIRGEELANASVLNHTLQKAKADGMQLHFINRQDYRLKNSITFQNKLIDKFGNSYLIPEGGTNALAIKGCEEILTDEDAHYDFITCAMGTGGTFAGLVNSSHSHQKVIGFPVLKGNFLKNDIKAMAKNPNYAIINDYHFGGYAKFNDELIQFIDAFFKKNMIPLEPIYTGKHLFGVFDLINKGYFPKKSKILAIHTGGLQGFPKTNEYEKIFL